MATAWRRLGGTLALDAVLAAAVVLAPQAALAADEAGAPVTAAAMSGVTGEAGSIDPAHAGPLLLLLVAGTLGLLAAMSGPERATSNRSVHRPHEHTH